jgi:hypothetical protein
MTFMSVAGLCQICESREAKDTCGQCGRTVCSQHYDDAFGLCMDCAETTGRGSGPGQSDGPGREDVGDDVRF